jgi:hypothetical protein
VAAVAGVAALFAAGLAGAATSTADTRPPSGTPATVSADALPTTQVDGVVWSQVVVGNTVYAGGSFTTARPAGAAPGRSTVKRANLLAYDIRTGVLASFAPVLNGQVLAVTASPDGKRLYAVGDFTVVNGARRSRVAAFDTATGKLVTTFAPSLNASVKTVAATASRVYVGGTFTVANGVARSHLAALAPATGKLLSWAPPANGQVLAMVVAPGGASLVVGGRFTTLGGKGAYGLGALSTTTGGTLPFRANATIRDAGSQAAIMSLTTDGKRIYGTGYVYGSVGNFEGTFAANPSNGALIWVADCHGDTYSAFARGGVVYTVGHAHFCGNIGGFPETTPRTYHRALALTTAATGTVAKNTTGKYANFGGLPAPSLLTWFPTIPAGTYTGQSQGAWSVAGNASYLVLGGEFPSVNGHAQQGLVRFGVSSLAPNKVGPVGTAADFDLQSSVLSSTQLRLSWRVTWDPDNRTLTYRLLRSEGSAPPAQVYQAAFGYSFWRLAIGGFTDTQVQPGHTYTYQVTATDPFGNVARSAAVTVTIPD